MRAERVSLVWDGCIYRRLIIPDNFCVTLVLLLLEAEAAGGYKSEFVFYIFKLTICTSHLESSPDARPSCSVLKLNCIYRDIHTCAQGTPGGPIRPTDASLAVTRASLEKCILACGVNEGLLLAAPVIINSSDSWGIFSGGERQWLYLERIHRYTLQHWHIVCWHNSISNLGSQNRVHAHQAWLS